jgi:hypothetical protein
MKKYIKPEILVEKYEITNVIAALSENTGTTLHPTEDTYEWDDFWN